MKWIKNKSFTLKSISLKYFKNRESILTINNLIAGEVIVKIEEINVICFDYFQQRPDTHLLFFKDIKYKRMLYHLYRTYCSYPSNWIALTLDITSHMLIWYSRECIKYSEVYPEYKKHLEEISKLVEEWKERNKNSY